MVYVIVIPFSSAVSAEHALTTIIEKLHFLGRVVVMDDETLDKFYADPYENTENKENKEER